MNDATETPKEKDEPTIWFVDDELWTRIGLLLVVTKNRKKPGRPRTDDRPIFNALIWLARTGAQWSQLPECYPPKSTVHDRLVEWVVYGNLAAVWALLLSEYDNRFGIQWTWQAADGCITKAPLGKRGLQARRRASAPTLPTGASRAPNAIC